MIRSRSRTGPRAALLLEVVVALAIMVAALGMLGTQLVSGLEMTSEADRQTRGAELVDRLLALIEFDPEMESRLLEEEQADGDFGDQYPGWFWEISFQPVEQVPGLGQVRATVLYQEDPDRQDSPEGARIIRQVVLLRAARGEIDLVEDFGMDEEAVAELADMLPMEFDPTAVDPQILVTLATEDPEMLMQMLPALVPLLQQYFGSGLEGPAAQLLGPGGAAALGDLGGEAGEKLQGMLGELGGQMGDLEGDLGLPPARGGGEVRGGAGGARRGGGRAGASAGRGTGGRRGGATGGRRGGAAGSAGTPDSGQPRYTIEDLMRLREELRGQGGG